jgi:hypothetical protein
MWDKKPENILLWNVCSANNQKAATLNKVLKCTEKHLNLSLGNIYK